MKGKKTTVVVEVPVIEEHTGPENSTEIVVNGVHKMPGASKLDLIRFPFLFNKRALSTFSNGLSH